jgi:hypothetical protein
MTPLVNRPIALHPGRSIGQLAMTPLVNRPIGCHRDREWAIGAAERRGFTGSEFGVFSNLRAAQGVIGAMQYH